MDDNIEDFIDQIFDLDPDDEHRRRRHHITAFTCIKERHSPHHHWRHNHMVPLSAGNTATFATTPIPSNAVPNPAALPVWTSSDTTNAPVVAVATDPTGLSATVTFPATVLGGVTFSLTITYTNQDGSVASQTNQFTTVAPPSPDITAFTPIVQTA